MAGDPLLTTKIQLPLARANFVSRPRLLARLADGLAQGRRLTLVCAPAGFGKTTLIREWAGRGERPVAWLALDEGDNEAGRFLRYLVAALGQAEARLGAALADLEAPPAAVPDRAWLIALVNRVAADPAPVTLVLDDYHLVADFAVHEAVTFLLEQQPPNLHVVIGTREDPPLPLARLRGRDQLTEIRESALRFRDEEAAAFLRQTMRLDVSPTSLAALMARTEGWITGLQLAGVALGQRAAGDAFVAAFAGDDRYILEYLMAEVLARQPAAVRDFLRQTAILERLAAPVCDALTGRNDSQALLAQLEAANLFLVPLDDHREWYRYHVIFAEALRLTLTAAEQIALHRRAAAWFQAHGLAEQAQRHARRLAELHPVAGPRPGQPPAQPLVEPLSSRELEVLRLIAEGCGNAEIARRLFITLGTVKRHTNNIYGKLGAESRTQAVARGRILGLIE